MKIFILGDLEGTAGVVDFKQQTYSDAKYYEQAKRLATLEVNALVEGVLEGGAKEIWFLDGHGPGGIDYELMHAEVQMIIGRPIYAPWGLDESFDAFFLYGHHAMDNTERGVLCHSWSSRAIANCWLNGELIGEIGFNAAIAGSFGIPTVFISGDDTAIAEAQGYVPNIVSVMTKRGISRTSALSLAPVKARELLRTGGRKAMGKIDEIEPYTIEPPYEFITEMRDEKAVNAKAEREDVERLDSHKYKVVGETLIEIAQRR
ncbi:MAG: M55 family metallopeptidase [Candidatus Poribacteria bacterium]|nr:M55 family metallopeptidase [Candidatus Poribacteria bacterium]